MLLVYHVYGDAPALPARAASQRADALWKTTCFELFLRPAGGDAYVELNFSPSMQWAAYAFDSYRSGMRDLPLRAPAIQPIEPENGAAYGLAVELDLSGLPAFPAQASLTAVIEEADGTKSYWALAHPTGKPDFHDPACFMLELAAAKAP